MGISKGDIDGCVFENASMNFEIYQNKIIRKPIGNRLSDHAICPFLANLPFFVKSDCIKYIKIADDWSEECVYQ